MQRLSASAAKGVPVGSPFFPEESVVCGIDYSDTLQRRTFVLRLKLPGGDGL